jgi:peptidoglycan/xylan/chitin deacetylase (PgdA/CDA1 family)
VSAPESLPHYYSALAPFRASFLTSAPVLAYHHVGPRRRGARLKGLYVSPGLFRQQMAELHAEGFSAPRFEGVSSCAASGAAPRRVFLTFDDGFRDVFEHALPVLREHGFCSIQFLISDLLGETNKWQQPTGDISEPLMDDAQVKDWLAAGQEIGSHTKTHPRLTQISPAAAREEITASKKSLEDRFGVPVEHFCYPYGDWNAAVRDLVQVAGYKTACTTRTGLNPAGTKPFELKRFTARYPSRNLKALWSWVRSWGVGE